MIDFCNTIIRNNEEGKELRRILTAALIIFVLLVTIINPTVTALSQSKANILSEASASDRLPERDYYDLNEGYVPEEVDYYLGDDYDPISGQYAKNWTQEYNHESVILYEDTERRTSTAKHFFMDDGSYMVLQYAEEIHYEVDGRYEDIDNTLVKNAQNVLENSKNSIKVTLPELYSEEASTNISLGKYSLSFNLMEYISLDEAQIKNELYLHALDNDPYELTLRNNSSVKYNLNSGIQLEYQIIGTTLKENIIINYKMPSYIFSFDIRAENLWLMADEYGNILALNEFGDMVFEIPSGYMYDAKGDYSSEVWYELEETKEGYILKVIPNADWINSKDRTFPIIVDPMVTVPSDGGSVITGSRGTISSNRLPVSAIVKSFINFDISAIIFPVGTTIVDAKLKFYSINSTGAEKLLFLYECDKEWAPNNIPDDYYFDTGLYLPDQQQLISTGTVSNTLDITRNVKNWIEFNKNNFGFAFTLYSGSTGTIYIPNQAYSTSSQRPSLQINYRQNIGLESYWDYDVFEVGANSVYINKYNNQTTVVHEDIALGGNFPIVLQHVYLDAYRDDNYRVNTIYNGVNYGYGWKLNYQQIIRYRSEGYYDYYDADGTLHRLVPNGSGQYVDEAGLGLILKYSGGLKMTDRYKNEYYFDYHGRLFRMQDRNGKGVNIKIGDGESPTVAGLPITEISDDEGRAITFIYDSQSGYLLHINYKGIDGITTAETTFEYSSGQLIKITKHDDTYSEYFYNDNSLIIIREENYYSLIMEPLLVTIIEIIDEKELKDFYYGRRIIETFWEGDSEGTAYYTVRNRLENFYFNGITVSVSAKEGQQFYDFDNPSSYFSNNFVVDNVYDSYGRLVSAYVAGQEISTTVARRYTESDGLEIKRNKVSATTSYESNVINYLKNYSFESSTGNWSKSVIGSSVYTKIASSNRFAYIGEKSLELFMAQPSLTELRAQQTITLPAGSYILSAYIKVFDTLMYRQGKAEDYGAFIAVNSSNTVYESSYITNDMFANNNGFSLYQVRFTLQNEGEVTVYAALKNCSGFAYFDGLQVVRDDFGYTDKYNLIENAGFEYITTPTLPDNWSFDCTNGGIVASDLLDIIYSNNDFLFSGNNSLMFRGAGPFIGASISQIVSLPISSLPISYTLSAWFNTIGRTALPAENSAVKLNYRLLDKNNNPLSDFMGVDISLQSIHWHQVAITFVAMPSVRKVEVNIQLDMTSSILLIDNVSLVPSQIMNYSYDNNGGLSSYEDGSGVTYGYTDDDINVGITRDGVEIYGVTKDSAGNVLSSVNYNRNIKASYTYDQIGRVLTNTISSLVGTKKIMTETQYSEITSNFEHTVTDIDSLGFSVISNYYSFYDLLSRTTFNDGSYTEYTYAFDTVLNNQIKTITITNKDPFSEVLSSVVYTYYLSNEYFIQGYNRWRAMGMLKSVTLDNGTEYSYVYDKWGNILQVKLNDTVQIEYTYSSLDGKLSSKNLATGYTEYYYYDQLGRMCSLETQADSYSSINLAYEWEYSVEGSLVCMKNYILGKVFTYRYDNSSRLIIQEEREQGSNKAIYYEYVYDKFGAIADINTVIYEGPTMSGMITSSLISTTGTLTRSRTGNIEIISIDGIEQIKYTYDDSGLLIREDNKLNKSTAYPTGVTILYNRDINGNITGYDLSRYNQLTTGKISYDPYYIIRSLSYSYDGASINAWNSLSTYLNQEGPSNRRVTILPDEMYGDIPITNILRMHQQSYYVYDPDRYVSLVDAQSLGSYQMTLSYWVRKEEIGPNVLGLRFRYTDGSYSSSTILADHTEWQKFTITSDLNKIVCRIELAYYSSCWINIGSARLDLMRKNLKTDMWSNTAPIANQVAQSTYPVTVQTFETYNGVRIGNILRMHQQSFYASGTFYSLLNTSAFGSSQMTLTYWIRKETLGKNVVWLRFYYTDGSYSPSALIADTLDWQQYSITSDPNKTVAGIRLGYHDPCWVRVGNVRLDVGEQTEKADLWNNTAIFENQAYRSDRLVTPEADEVYGSNIITNILRMHQQSYYQYSPNSHIGLIDVSDVGQYQMTLSYWIRKETTGSSIKGLCFRYTDSSASSSITLADTLNWQHFVIVSDPNKTVESIILYYSSSSWVRIGNAELMVEHIPHKADVWDNDMPLALQIAPTTYPVTTQPNEVTGSTRIVNILRLHQHSFYSFEYSNYMSLINTSNIAGYQLTLTYWIRKETLGTEIRGLRFQYSDGTKSSSTTLANTLNWQKFTITSDPNRIVTGIELGYNYPAWVRIGNVRLFAENLAKIDGRVSSTAMINGNYSITGFDELGRQTVNTIHESQNNMAELLKETYTYLDGAQDNTSYTVTSKAIMAGASNSIIYSYTYNMDNPALGSVREERPYPYNIWQIKENNVVKVQYYYDLLGRLSREDNVYINATITYEYDGNNNIVSKTTYAYTTSSSLSGGTAKTYTYNDPTFRDRLTGYNGGTITYDAIGNPLSYLGNTLTWNGRSLSSWTDGITDIAYAYDSNGIRVSKTVNGITTEYLYNGSQLLRETRGSDTIWYLYSDQGLVGIEINGVTYYYIRNLEGDVNRIIDTSGNTVVEYIYDTWGKVLSVTGSLASTVGEQNSIRYRGYYYDTETNLYYLNSRYYDPETGRFISPDVVAEGGNLYAYCVNDPVNRTDESGYLSQKWKTRLVKIAIGTALAIAAIAITVATGGAAAPVIAGIVQAVVIGGVIGGGVAAVSHRVGTGSWDGVMDAVSEGILDGMIDGYILGSVMQFVGAVGNAVSAGGKISSTTSSAGNTTPLRGTQNPKVKAAATRGREMHKTFDYGADVIREVRIPGGRVDAVDYGNKILFELKPNNPAAIAKGQAQLARYLKHFPGFIGKIVTY